MSKDVSRQRTNPKFSLRKKGRSDGENTLSGIESLSVNNLNESGEFQQPKNGKGNASFPHPASSRTRKTQLERRDVSKEKKLRSVRVKGGNSDSSSCRAISGASNGLEGDSGMTMKCQDTVVCSNTRSESSGKAMACDQAPVEKEEKSDDKECTGEEGSVAVGSDEDCMVRCASCGQGFSQQTLQLHLRRCLRAKFERTAQQSVTETIASGPGTSVDEAGGNNWLKKESDSDDPYFCQFCGKDLSSLNTKLKAQHLNRCMDKEEKKKNVEDMEKLALQRAKTAVLSCPMCGRPSKTENARKVHLKKCAVVSNVTTDQMLTLVKDQEEEYRTQLAAGILPPGVRKLKDNGAPSSSRGRKVREPKNQFDEDTQMAMAISSSLDEERKDWIGETSGTDSTTAMSLMQASSVTVGGRRKRRKKGEPEVVPLLLALSEEEKQRRRESNVTNIVIPKEGDEEMDNTPKFTESGLMIQQDSPHLWKSSVMSDRETKAKDRFYVKSLMPPIQISQAAAGTKIRRMSEIPGRDTTIVCRDTGSLIGSKERGDITLSGDYLVATTQTAVVLAELAASDDEDLDCSVHCSGFCPEKAIKIKLDTQCEVMRGFQTSMLGLINNPVGSDVTIIVDGEEIHAHVAVLASRCPQLLQWEKDSRIVCSDVSCDVMMAVLKYVYGGQVSLYPSNVADVLELSKRLKLDELSNICEKLQLDHAAVSKLENSSDRSSEQDDSDTINNHQSDVENLLKSVWGDDSFQEEEDHQVSSDTSPTKQSRDITDDDDTDIRSSQRQKLHSGNTDTSDKEDLKEDKSDVDDCKKIKLHRDDCVDLGLCKDKLDGSNVVTTDKNLQEEIDNFFQDESFDMTCDLPNEEDIPQDGCDISKTTRSKDDTNQSPNSDNDKIVISESDSTVYEESISKSSSQGLLTCESHSTDQDTFEGQNNKSKVSEGQNHKSKVSEGQSNKGHVSEGQSNKGQVSEGRNNKRQVSEGQSNKGQVSEGQSNKGQFSEGQNNKGQVSEGQSNKGHVSEGQSNKGQFSEGRNNKGQVSEGQRNKGQVSEEEMTTTDKVTDDAIVIDSDESDNEMLTSKSEEGKQASPKGVCKYMSQRKSSEECHLFGDSSNGSDDVSIVFEEKNQVDTSPPKSDSPHSPDLIGYEDIEQSFHNRSSPSRKRKRDIKFIKTKSPVAIFTTPEKRESMSYGMSTPDIDVSGLDLFGSPSPYSKHRKTDSPAKVNRERTMFDRNVRSPHSPCKPGSTPKTTNLGTNTESLRRNSPTVSSSSKEPLNTFDTSSPTFSFSQKHVTRKLCISEELMEQAKSTNDDFGDDKHLPSTHNITSVDCDVEIIKDNLEEFSEGSPRFSGREKKKWKFTKPTRGIQSRALMSDMTMRSGSGNQEEMSQTGACDSTSCMTDPVWTEVSPVKDPKEDLATALETTLETTVINDDLPSPTDVWAGFDDSGAGFGGLVASDTPGKCHQISDEDEAASGTTNDRVPSPDNVQTPKLHRHLEETPKHSADPGRELANDLKLDDSFLWEADNAPVVPADADVEMEDKDGCAKDKVTSLGAFKTPTVSTRQKTTTAWVPPSPFTPMASYDQMNTPQLKSELQRIGVRPVGKKRMVKLLKDVYEQTHQYEVDSDYEDSEEEVKQSEGGGYREADTDGPGEEEEEEEDRLNSSQDSSSQSDMVEESFMQGTCDDLPASQQMVQKDEAALPEKLYNFVKERPDIYCRILVYEPLEVDWLKKEITDAGIKCSMQKLLDFLDEKCITFTMKKIRQDRNARKGRGRKKASPKKQGEISPSKQGSPKKRGSKKQAKGSPSKKKSRSPKKKGPSKGVITVD